MKTVARKNFIALLTCSSVIITVLLCVFVYEKINNTRYVGTIDSVQATLSEAINKISDISNENEENKKMLEEANQELALARDEIESLKVKETTTEPTTTAPPVSTTKPLSFEEALSRLDGSGKKVFLTFDDGPSDLTLEILDMLDYYDIKATFFVVNRGSKPQYMTQINERGHAIGLHSYSHDYKKIYSSEEAFFDDLQKIADVVKQYVGIEPKIMRFPGGSSNLVSSFNPKIMTSLVQKVQERGYTYFDWNCTNGDGEDNGIPVQTLIENTVRSAARNDSDLTILMHDNATKLTTLKALPEIIEILLSKGYTFDVLSETVVPVHHTVAN